MAYSVRIVFTLTSFSLFLLGFQAEGATPPVPHQLYGKSVTISRVGEEVFEDEITGKATTLHMQITDDFYFSSLGRIFARRLTRNQFGSRTFEQLGSDPSKVQRATHATGRGQSSLGTGLGTFQDLHFEGRTLIGIWSQGENGAIKLAIEFDQNLGTCTAKMSRGTDNGKSMRRIGWSGHVERVITPVHWTSQPTCVVRDGNIFE
jgi:hypothetical protein